MFIKLSHNLHALFLQTRERDKAKAHLAELKEGLEQAAAEVADHGGEVHVAGELLPEVDLTMPRAVVKREGKGQVTIESVAARMVVKAGTDSDQLQVALEDVGGRKTDQTVEALQLQAACFRLLDGGITWKG
jgi:hypothetical protein